MTLWDTKHWDPPVHSRGYAPKNEGYENALNRSLASFSSNNNENIRII